MLSPLIKREIFKEAKRCHYQVPSDYEKILEKAQKVNTISDDKIVFSWLYNSDSVLNSSSMVPHLILCNKRWAIRLVFFNNEDTMNAFFITIGHELTHKEKDYFSWTLSISASNLLFPSTLHFPCHRRIHGCCIPALIYFEVCLQNWPRYHRHPCFSSCYGVK